MVKKLFILLLYILLTLSSLGAQEEASSRQKGGVLFLNTDPLGAFVLLDGTLLPETTPILLRDLEPGTYSVELRKEGYRTEKAKLYITAQTPLIRHTSLEYQNFRPLFPEEERIVVNGSIIEASEGSVLLQDGTYTFRRGAGTLYIDPVYPKQGILSALHFSITLLAGLSTLLTVNDILRPQSDYDSTSPSVILSWGLTLSLSTVDLFLLADRKTYRENLSLPVLSAPPPAIDARGLFERGEHMLSLGNLVEALRYYGELIEGFPDSPYLPEALYKTAKIHSITGENTLAEEEMRLILERYPVPELYDKTCQNLAILLFRQGDFEKSLTYLDAMVFVDPLFSREEVALYGSDILRVWSDSVKTEDIE